MNYITASQAASRWGVSEGIVRRYCRDERIPGAYQEFETWYIPENAAKPTRRKKEASQLPKGAFDGIVRSVLKEFVSIYPHIRYAVVLELLPPKTRRV